VWKMLAGNILCLSKGLKFALERLTTNYKLCCVCRESREPENLESWFTFCLGCFSASMPD